MSQALIKVFLMPGEYHVGDARSRIRTLLGSCVSITLWQPKLQIGAMSHFVLCTQEHEGPPNARYGEDALALMLGKLQALGVKPGDCQAKIFGGGAMFTDGTSGQSLDIGRRNGETARRLLLSHGIPVVSESLFGAGHRQIVFNVKTGDVWVRHVNPQSDGLSATAEAKAWASKS